MVTPSPGSSSEISSTVAVRQQFQMTKSVVSVRDSQSPTAEHPDCHANMVLDLDNAAAVLATSATNCVDFADKATTITIGCSNVFDNSENDPKDFNISKS